MFMYLALLFMEPAGRLVKETNEKNKIKTRGDIDYTEVPKNLPSLVRARRKGFFGESVG